MLVQIADRSKATFAEAVAPYRLPVHLARAILLLDSPAPMRALSEHLACDRSYITGLADQLEERGLITRTPGQDRRVKLLTLTEAGQQLRDELSEAVAEQSLVLRRLNDSEREALDPLLERLLAEEG